MAGKSKAERLQIVDRQIEALTLRKRGFTYREIGAKFGISYVQAIRDVQSALKEALKNRDDSAEELRELELDRLDMLLKALEPYASVGNVPSVMAFLRVCESRRKLLGLDAPEKVDHTSGGEKMSLVINIGSENV